MYRSVNLYLFFEFGQSKPVSLISSITNHVRACSCGEPGVGSLDKTPAKNPWKVALSAFAVRPHSVGGTDGFLDGSRTGMLDGSVEGKLDRNILENGVGTIDGTPVDGRLDEILEGTLEGKKLGWLDGFVEIFEGIGDSYKDGKVDGKTLGYDVNDVEGTSDGAFDIISEGKPEKEKLGWRVGSAGIVFEGTIDGVVDGIEDGAIDRGLEGKSEGKGVGYCVGDKVKTFDGAVDGSVEGKSDGEKVG